MFESKDVATSASPLCQIAKVILQARLPVVPELDHLVPVFFCHRLNRMARP